MSLTEEDIKLIGEEFERFLQPVYDRFNRIDRRLDEMEETLDAHTASLMKIESTLGAYADADSVNRDQIKTLDQRVTAIENHLNLPTPPKLA